MNKSIYNFELTTIDGEPVKLDKYEGKSLLIVNVASKCGFTGQYEGLQAVWDKYKDKDFVLIGIPSNDFYQEYKDEKDVEIQKLKNEVDDFKTMIEKSKNSYEEILDKTTKSIEKFIENAEVDQEKNIQ